jgi:hypothetical protein
MRAGQRRRLAPREPVVRGHGGVLRGRAGSVGDELLAHRRRRARAPHRRLGHRELLLGSGRSAGSRPLVRRRGGVAGTGRCRDAERRRLAAAFRQRRVDRGPHDLARRTPPYGRRRAAGELQIQQRGRRRLGAARLDPRECGIHTPPPLPARRRPAETRRRPGAGPGGHAAHRPRSREALPNDQHPYGRGCRNGWSGRHVRRC